MCRRADVSGLTHVDVLSVGVEEHVLTIKGTTT